MDVKEIETAIAQLHAEKVAELAEWFAEFQARLWDEQIERDAEGGRLDSPLEQAARDFESELCEPL